MSKPKRDSKNGKAPVAEPAEKVEQEPKAGGKETAKPQGDAPPTEQEKEMFAVHEETIKQNLGAFVKVGKALKAIQLQKLHRVAKFDSFEDYCREQWGLSRQYAYRLMDAYTCMDKLQKALSPKGEKVLMPANESQVRSMTALEPEKQVKAWQQVLKSREGKSITADEVKTVVDKMLGQPGKEKITGSNTKSNEAEQKLVKIEKLVTKALEDDPEPTVATLKQVLEKIQKLLGIEK